MCKAKIQTCSNTGEGYTDFAIQQGDFEIGMNCINFQNNI